MKVGATLSGGFLRGAAHIGFLKALEYKGYPPSFVCGASAGAVVGALYCAGYSPERILEIAKGYSWRKLASPSFKGGLFKLEGLYKGLVELIGKITFRELKIPLCVAVVNLRTLKVEFKREGEVAATVVASCSLPPIFAPWKVGNEYYIDGGIRNCLPAEATKAFGVDINICSNVNHISERDYSPTSLVDVAFRGSLAALLENQERRFPYCDIIVNHSPSTSFDFRQIESIAQKGYEDTLLALEEVKYWL
jgi:NTE family protein